MLLPGRCSVVRSIGWRHTVRRSSSSQLGHRATRSPFEADSQPHRSLRLHRPAPQTGSTTQDLGVGSGGRPIRWRRLRDARPSRLAAIAAHEALKGSRQCLGATSRQPRPVPKRFWRPHVRAQLLIVLAASPVLAGWEPLPWPHAGQMPDDPGAGGPSHYRSITAGTKTYRPVEPLPWDELNRRVAPKGALPPKVQSAPNAKDGKAAPADQAKPPHKH